MHPRDSSMLIVRATQQGLSLPSPGSPQEFPSSFFLDPAFFQSLSSTAFVCSAWPCESQLKSSLGSDIDAICQHYFSTIHKWLPILSKKRLLNLLNNPAAQDEESQSPLLVCMKLASNLDHDDGAVRNPALYQLAKVCCTAMERDRFISLRLVQCLTLIAVYELGHAIFPEAYVTIGHASRLVIRHSRHLDLRRRTAPNLVGDIFVGQICQYRASESLLTTSFHSTANLGSFARTCQAAHILNKVLKHRDHRTHSGQDNETVLNEALALHGALVALEESLAPHCVFLGDLHNDESAGTVDSPSAHPGPEVVITATSPGMENALALSLSASVRMVLYKIYGPNEPKAGYGGGRTALETQMQRLSLRQLATEWQVANEYLALLEKGGILRLIPDEQEAKTHSNKGRSVSK
ncbi:Transcription factor BOA15 like protein [Verticillium longisporum]|nr:Transcription factor BOA15 like protein [Verticillium longisporum]